MQKVSLIVVFLLLVFGLLDPSYAFPAQQKETEESDPDAWEERWNSRQPADKVMDAIGIEPGMMIGEIGAGRGRYVVQVAERIGPKGRVYANDINSTKLEYLRFRCERDSITNVETILGTVTDPRLPEGKLDFVYFINTYHHIEKPVELLENTVPALKSDGQLVIIEHAPEKMSSPGHSTPEETVIEQATEAGFELVRMERFLEFDNIYIFRVKE
ncbi:MAG: methyltransferase domain-containing protein [Candidatus Latescibacteria bacterium]|nr:methyltransferase domain-containing protein [Candidatus Latescibacterota bacterium]NIO56160.1 methyltransferase domain-containing protein [Candidatus Latescibacterota bacterium]